MWFTLRLNVTLGRLSKLSLRFCSLFPYSSDWLVILFPTVPEGIPQNITPAATSATSVTLAWKPPSLKESNGVIVGYIIILFDKLRNTTRNITVMSLDQVVIEDLFPFTEYEARLMPFNSKGISNVSDVISVRTKEAGES